MPLIKENINNFEIKNNQVYLKKDFLFKHSWRFKKITGSRFASILNFNKYTTPFREWMTMVNLYRDVMDKTLAEVGNTIEPKVRDYVQQKLNIKFRTYIPQQINYDAFKDSKFFGGIPDGEPINENGVVDYSNNQRMIEIKTTSIDSFVYKKENGGLVMQKDVNNYPIVKFEKAKRDEWFDQNRIVIPIAYQLQLGLYMYLRNTTKGIFAIAFLKKEDYKDFNNFNPEEREIRIINFDCVDTIGFKQYIDQAQEWYQKHVVTGISPIMSEEDKLWLEEEKTRCH